MKTIGKSLAKSWVVKAYLRPYTPNIAIIQGYIQTDMNSHGSDTTISMTGAFPYLTMARRYRCQPAVQTLFN